MNSIKEFFAQHRNKILTGAAFLAMLVLAYATGRYLQPANVVEKEKVVTRVEIQEKIVEKVVEKKVYVEVEAKVVHKETTTVKGKDGTETTKTVEDTKSDTHKNGEDTKTADKVVERVVEKVVIKEVEKIVTAAKPNWRLGPMVGVDLRTALGGPPQLIPQLGPMVIGVQVERRVLGPISLGVYGQTSGVVGASLTVEF